MNNYMDYNKFKYELFKQAQKHGIKEYELYYEQGESLKVGVYKGEIDVYDASVSCGAGFRAKINDRMGYAYTEILDDRSIEVLISAAMQNAHILDTANEEFVYNEEDTYVMVNTYNEQLDDITPQEITEFSINMEKSACEYDERVNSVKTSASGIYKHTTHISNSAGLELKHSTNGFYAYVMPVVKKDEEVRTAVAYRTGRDISAFKPADIASEAVIKAISYLGAKPVKAGQYRVLFSNEAAEALLDTYSGIFTAESVQKGLSLLRGKKGTQIASDVLTIIDDPLLPNGMCSRPFDCEGVASRKMIILDNGVLKSYLYNLKTAKKDNERPTGNATRSYSSGVGTAPSNFYIQPGKNTIEEMMRSLENGLYITEIEGLHAGANTVSGDFSLSSKGFLVEKGKKVRAVSQITVAGNIYELFNNIESVGSDLKFGLHSSSGCFGSPSVLVSKLTASGS